MIISDIHLICVPRRLAVADAPYQKPAVRQGRDRIVFRAVVKYKILLLVRRRNQNRIVLVNTTQSHLTVHLRKNPRSQPPQREPFEPAQARRRAAAHILHRIYLHILTERIVRTAARRAGISIVFPEIHQAPNNRRRNILRVRYIVKIRQTEHMAVFMDKHAYSGQSTRNSPRMVGLVVHVHHAVEFAGASILQNVQRVRPAAQIYHRPNFARLRPYGILFISIRGSYARIYHVHVIHVFVAVVVVLAEVDIAPPLNHVDGLGEGRIGIFLRAVIRTRFRKRHRRSDIDRRLEDSHGIFDKILTHAPAHPVFGIAVLVHVARKILLRSRRLKLDIAELHENHQHVGLAHCFLFVKTRSRRTRKDIFQSVRSGAKGRRLA